MYQQLHNLLIEAGLSENEVLVYLTLLKQPVPTKWELVLSTGLSKSSLYRAFDKLKSLKLIEQKNNHYQAASLKSLVAELNTTSRKQKKLANRIKHIAPFLHLPAESVDSLETLYTSDQISEAYLFMSEHDYNVNLEFGDFENLVPVMGSFNIPIKFRDQRAKHASSKPICTTFGPNSEYFSTREACQKFKVDVKRFPVHLGGSFIQFSDNADYVLFHYFSDPENPHSVLIKSKAIAELQRQQFDCFSQIAGKH